MFSRSNSHQLARFESWEEAEQFGHQGARVNQEDALGLKHHHGDQEFGQVLLKREISVASDQDIELSLSQSEEAPVFDAIPVHVLNRFDVVTRKLAR